MGVKVSMISGQNRLNFLQKISENYRAGKQAMSLIQFVSQPDSLLLAGGNNSCTLLTKALIENGLIKISF